MIDVKTAAGAGADYLKQLYPDAKNIQLEELEVSEDEKFWSVTLSYDDNDKTSYNFNRAKKYKIFKIDANTGNVLSMKIRELL